MSWIPGTTRPGSEWSPDDRFEAPDREVRERREDFETPTHEIEGASTERRPDAIALDYWTAHTLGPVREGDTSEGLVAWTWRARTLDGYTVTLTRETETRDGWEPNGAVFTITDGGPPIIELDVAFEQTGNAVVCASRATGPDGGEEVWIYFYDPTVPGYVFRNFGPGRTPRALLDRPLEIADSDVLVFYISDEAGRIVYRQQRDRYQVEIATPAAADENVFVEDAVKLADRRVAVVYTVRDPETGTYSDPLLLVSTLPPYVTVTEEATARHALVSVNMKEIIIDAPPVQVEQLTASQTLRSVVMREPVVEYESDEIEHVTASHALVGVALRSVVIEYESDEVEHLTASHALVGIDVVLAITIDLETEAEALTASHSLLDVILEAA